MSSASISITKPPALSVAVPRGAWVWVGLLGLLFVVLFRHWLTRMLRIATNAEGTNFFEVVGGMFSQAWNQDWSHALVIPFIGLLYLRMHRTELLAAAPEARWRPFEHLLQWGAVLIAVWWAALTWGLFPTGMARTAGVMAFALRGPLIVGAWVVALLGPLAFVTVWQRALAAAGVRVSMAAWMRMLGLLLLLTGIANYAFWIYPGRNDMLQGYSVILSLMGLVLLVLGPARMKVLLFPVLFLLFAVKIADRQWEQIAWQMQWIASRSSGVVLNVLSVVTGVSADVSGTTIELYRGVRGVQELGKLNVEEACAGLRMLMAFMSLGVAMAFLFDRPWWQRVIMCLMTVPIALLVNIGRVTTLGLLYPIDPELASGDFHTFIGLLMLIPAALLFMAMGWVMDKIIVYDDVPAAPGMGGASAASGPSAESVGMHPMKAGAGAVCGVAIIAALAAAAGTTVLNLRPDLAPEGWTPGVLMALATAVAAVLVVTGVVMTWRGRVASVPGWGFTQGLAAGVLLTCALGLQRTVDATDIVLMQKPVPLRQKLWNIPESLSGWRMEGKDEVLTAEIEDVLGTRDYISRTYRDLALGEGGEGAFARLHVAYYTGTPDTVPHVPDRCYVAGGLRGLATTGTVLKVGGAGHTVDEDGQAWAFSRLAEAPVRIPRQDVPATLFSFAADEGSGPASNVIYFFAANGKYLPSPEAVRAQAFGLRDKYSYYCKIEVGFFGVGDPDTARERTEAFLTAVLPEIMACLPDWVEVTQGRWPPPDSSP